MLESFLSGGHAAELILALVCCEFLALLLQHRRGRGAPLRHWLSPLLAGAFLVIALRLAQSTAPQELLGLSLAAAGVAHLLGVKSRWRG